MKYARVVQKAFLLIVRIAPSQQWARNYLEIQLSLFVFCQLGFQNIQKTVKNL